MAERSTPYRRSPAQTHLLFSLQCRTLITLRWKRTVESWQVERFGASKAAVGRIGIWNLKIFNLAIFWIERDN
jgi:hypothetical protein